MKKLLMILAFTAVTLTAAAQWTPERRADNFITKLNAYANFSADTIAMLRPVYVQLYNNLDAVPADLEGAEKKKAEQKCWVDSRAEVQKILNPEQRKIWTESYNKAYKKN